MSLKLCLRVSVVNLLINVREKSSCLRPRPSAKFDVVLAGRAFLDPPASASERPPGRTTQALHAAPATPHKRPLETAGTSPSIPTSEGGLPRCSPNSFRF